MENSDSEEKGISPRKRPEFIIVGHVGHGSSCATAMALAAARMTEKGHNIVVVNSIQELSEKTGKSLDEIEEIIGKENSDIPSTLPIRERAIELKSFALDEPEPIRLADMQNHNPWPSPKGRSGKRKW